MNDKFDAELELAEYCKASSTADGEVGYRFEKSKEKKVRNGQGQIARLISRILKR
ncbi:MAG: hypothetical protein OEW87_10755 [Flavobacteriaceae bacterium]|nr:hypothetical protein [Flavobacteriaceae bacterium]